MAEVNIWANKKLEALELSKIESLTGFECLLDYDDFTMPERNRGRRFANYFLGVSDETDDAELLEIFDADWAGEMSEKIAALKIPSIYRVG